MYETWLQINKKYYVGKKCGVVGLTRVGKCPICKQRVERSHTDIFFPYCGYKCKRVEQREEEERQKQKIAKEQKRYEEYLLASMERANKTKEKEIKKSEIEMARERLEKCQAEYEKHTIAFNLAPPGHKKKKYERDRLKYWHTKMIFAQKDVIDIERREETKNDHSNSTETEECSRP